MYDDDFFEKIQSGSLRSAQLIVPLLLEIVQPRSVIDVGGGTGTWLRAFLENGVEDVLGLDGSYVNREKLLIPQDRFLAVDLAADWSPPRKVDIVVCLEVGEHLPVRRSKKFIRSLTDLAPLILFSAALPGQGGHHHINEQWPYFWQQLFNERGYERLDPIRRHIWLDDRIQLWYRQNILLYASNEAIAQSKILQEEQARTKAIGLEIISQDILVRYTSVGGIVRELPRAIWRAMRRKWPLLS